jgi:hypothetical protein
MNEYYKNLSLDDIVYVDEDGADKVEVWGDVPDYEGYYQVSDLGRVKGFSRRNLIIKTQLSKIGYIYLVLKKNKISKTITVHQLVAITFLNHKPCGFRLVVDHINNVKQDNRLFNLQLLSNRENSNKERVKLSGKPLGVYRNKDSGSWRARIQHDKKDIPLGSFRTQNEADKYYQNALKAIQNGEEIISARKVKTSIHKGVYFDKSRGKYASRHKGKMIGRFNTENEAFESIESYIKNIENGIEIMPKRKPKTSIYKGVSFSNVYKKWIASFYLNKKRKTIGYFKTEIEAYEARENYIKNLNLQNETTLS